MDVISKSLLRLKPQCYHLLVLGRSIRMRSGRNGGGAGQSGWNENAPPKKEAIPNIQMRFREADHPFSREENEEADRENMPESGYKPSSSEIQYFQRRRFAMDQEPQSPTLLTWAAKEQIRFLYREDPLRWSHETLAEAFPINVDGVRRLVTGNSRYKSHPKPEQIARHDKNVRERWKALQTGKEGDVTPEQRQLFQQGNLNPVQAGVNLSFPLPPPTPEAFKLPPPPPGPFTNLISKDLERLRKAQEEKSLKVSKKKTQVAPAGLPATIDVHGAPSQYKLLQAAPSGGRNVYGNVDMVTVPDKDQVEVPDVRVRMSRRTSASRRLIMHEEVKEGIKSRSAEVHPEVGEAFQKWFGRFDAENVTSQGKRALKEKQKENVEVSPDPLAVKKYSGRTWEKGDKVVERRPDFEETICIPSHVQKENAIYKKGNAFYSHTGEFLYRVPS